MYLFVKLSSIISESPIQDTKKIFVPTEYITVGPDPEFFLSILTTEKGLYWLKNSDFVLECKSILA